MACLPLADHGQKRGFPPKELNLQKAASGRDYDPLVSSRLHEKFDERKTRQFKPPATGLRKTPREFTHYANTVMG